MLLLALACVSLIRLAQVARRATCNQPNLYIVIPNHISMMHVSCIRDRQLNNVVKPFQIGYENVLFALKIKNKVKHLPAGWQGVVSQDLAEQGRSSVISLICHKCHVKVNVADKQNLVLS